MTIVKTAITLITLMLFLACNNEPVIIYPASYSFSHFNVDEPHYYQIQDNSFYIEIDDGGSLTDYYDFFYDKKDSNFFAYPFIGFEILDETRILINYSDNSSEEGNYLFEGDTLSLYEGEPNYGFKMVYNDDNTTIYKPGLLKIIKHHQVGFVNSHYGDRDKEDYHEQLEKLISDHSLIKSDSICLSFIEMIFTKDE